MTPKEKAKELLDKMNNMPITIEEWNKASDYAKNNLKRKALIVVDELIEHCNYANKWYWQEVKQEIEKL
jgi:hypothetical protein